MDNKYWEKRYNGCYLNNDSKEQFIKEEQPFCESEFNEFISANKFLIPEIYIKFLRKYNGLEIDRKLSYTNSSGAEITMIIPIVLPFNQAIYYFKRLQEHKRTKSNFFPVALTSSSFHIFLLKVKGINKGKVYLFDGIMNDVSKSFNSIDEFFRNLEIDIY